MQPRLLPRQFLLLRKFFKHLTLWKDAHASDLGNRVSDRNAGFDDARDTVSEPAQF